jgi:hypothetical protein
MIRFACACGKEIATADELAGRQVQCPACGARTVPGPTDQIRERDPSWPQPLPRPLSVSPGDEDLSDRKPEKTSATSIWSLVIGISSLLVLGVGILAVYLGFSALSDIRRSRGRFGGRRLAVAGIVTGTLGTLLTVGSVLLITQFLSAGLEPGYAGPRPGEESLNNLKDLGRAMHDYAQENGTFPPAGGGKGMHPGLSWRVALLPYLGQEGLYRQLHLNEPWDSPHNIQFLTPMPRTFVLRGAPDPPGTTRYRVFVGEEAAFAMPGPGDKAPLGRSLKDLPELRATLFVIEAADAVPWTKPEELEYAADRPLPRFSTYDRGPRGLMGDGAVGPIKPDTPEELMRRVIAR